MTAVLAAAGRVVIGAVLVLVCVAAALWAAFGPQGLWTVLWLLALGVAIPGAVLAWFALQPEKGDPR